MEFYDGDAVSAMLGAGFSGDPSYLKQEGERLLNNPVIIEAIKERSRYMAKTFRVIADREERQALWSSIARNEDPHYKEERDVNGNPIKQGNIPIQARLKALELLGKSEGDFVENINLSGTVSITDLVMASYKIEDSVEAIEAEYYRAKEETEKAALEAPVPSLGDFL